MLVLWIMRLKRGYFRVQLRGLIVLIFILLPVHSSFISSYSSILDLFWTIAVTHSCCIAKPRRRFF